MEGLDKVVSVSHPILDALVVAVAEFVEEMDTHPPTELALGVATTLSSSIETECMLCTLLAGITFLLLVLSLEASQRNVGNTNTHTHTTMPNG